MMLADLIQNKTLIKYINKKTTTYKNHYTPLKTKHKCIFFILVYITSLLLVKKLHDWGDLRR